MNKDYNELIEDIITKAIQLNEKTGKEENELIKDIITEAIQLYKKTGKGKNESIEDIITEAIQSYEQTGEERYEYAIKLTEFSIEILENVIFDLKKLIEKHAYDEDSSQLDLCKVQIEECKAYSEHLNFYLRTDPIGKEVLDKIIKLRGDNNE